MGRWLAPLSTVGLLLAAVLVAGSPGQGRPAGPPGLAKALAAHSQHGQALRGRPGVVGSGVGIGRGGNAVLKVLVEKAGTAGLPAAVGEVPVEVEVSGKIHALGSTTDRHRPALPGISVGHPLITAGTIGARVSNASGAYILSNNHVVAGVATDDGPPTTGQAVYQPGVADGGTAADTIGTVAGYVPLKLCSLFTAADCLEGRRTNTVDAAIATVASADLSPQTFCGWTPSTSTTAAVLGLAVKKCGRTTLATASTVTIIDLSLDVCYDLCFRIGHFDDQIAIGGETFSAGGDSGSLVVTDDATASPVGLLFAGGADPNTGAAWTIANPIGPVLSALGVVMDSGGPAPPPPPPPPPPKLHLGGLDPSTAKTRKSWTARVTVTVHDDSSPTHQPVSGAAVAAAWGGGGSGTATCTTGTAGTCTVSKNFKLSVTSVVLTVTNVSRTGYTYDPAGNHPPPGNTVTVNRP